MLFRSNAPGDPSRRVYRHTSRLAPPDTSPNCTMAASTDVASIGWFLGENGSMEGGMIHVCDVGTIDGTYEARVKTKASAWARNGLRNVHADRLTSVSLSMPMCDRHTTCAPRRANGPARPAV